MNIALLDGEIHIAEMGYEVYNTYNVHYLVYL